MHRLLWFACAGLFALGCERPPTAPAKKLAAAEPGRVTLSKEAETRLGIPEGLWKVGRSRLPARRLHPGEVMPAPGQATLLTAPLGGTVTAVDDAGLPGAGARVRAGQPLLALTPLPVLGERAQVATALSEIEAQVVRARAQEQTAALALARAERLVRDGLAGEKLLEEAHAQAESARAARHAVESQQVALGAKTPQTGTSARLGLLAQTRIDAPFDGFVRDVRVAPQQHVPAGAALIEVVSRAARWVRVSVSSSQIATVASDQPALIGELSPGPGATPLTAAPILPSPETTQPGTGILELYFLLPERAPFRIGQRVAAWVAQTPAPGTPAGEEPADTEELTIPAAALLYGPDGEAWVYERTAPQVFLRRRVEVLRSESPLLVLRGTSGLRAGAELVTAGAAELQGVELGVGK